MGLDGMKAFVIEHRLDEPMGSRIAVDDGGDVGPKTFADDRRVLERV